MRSRCFVLLCTSTVAFIYTVNYLLQYEIHIRIWNHDNAIGAEGSYLLRPRIHFLVDTPTCSIPNMDGLSADLGRFISPMPPLACAPDAPLVVSNTTALHVRDLRHTCCYQELFREGDDTYWYDNRCTPIPPGGATVVNGSSSVEFVRVQCTVPGESSKEQSDFHAFVPAKAAVEQRCREPAIADGVSVLLLGMDSVSRLNFHRQMPLTVARLRDMGAIEMMGYNKVGDNTFPNMVGIFSGLNEQELKYECWDNDNMPFDKCPWIWKNFSDAGYRTMFIEDIPYIGMFNFKKKGFQKQPTDYYTRPFMTALDEEIGHKGTETSNRCAGSRLQIQIVLDYVQKFVTTFAESLYWGFAWSTSLSHDELNAPQLADPLFSAALKRMSDQQLMNNTVLILLSDHGMRTGSFRETYQGRLEERLPFLFFVFPDWFRRRYASAVATLQGNAHRLTSPFDLHATLADLLHLPALETAAREESPDARGVSLFSAAPENRTCEQAGIAQHWCTCHSTTTLSADSEMALRAADALVAFINGLLQPFKSNLIVRGRQTMIMEAEKLHVLVLDLLKDEEEQWISGEELYTEGSSEEDDVALKRRSAGKVPRKNLKGAIAKERKHGMRKSHVRPASASPSRLHTESTKLFTGPELALPESQLQHLSLSRPDELPRAERNYEESCDHPKQGTSSSSSAQRMETDEEQPEISWRPKRGSIKLPNLTPEGNAKTSELEDADVSYLEVLEDLKKLQSSNRASIIQEIAVSKEIESRIEDISIQKEERFDIEPVHDLQWDFLVEDDGDENLKSAFLKMNKLDALLQFTEDKEREAREETQSMQLQVREELEQLSECHGPYITELTKNTVSFLQLCPVPRNGGNIEDKPVPKMIHSDKSDTDILNQDIANNLNHNVEEIVSEKQETTLFKTEPQLLDKTDTSGINKGISKNISKPKKEKPDFILRNIKLASEGLGTLSITDAEKQKLAELLKDLDNDSDIKDHSLVVKNQLDGVSGYSMDPEIQQLLEEIDLKLEIVSTKNQFQGSNSRTSSIKETKITPKDALVEDNIHSWKVAEERQRLIEIDESLTIFNGPMKEEIDPLEDEELHRLVEYCSTHCSTAFGDESSKLNSDMCFAVSNSQLVPATTLTDNVLTQLVQQAMKFMPYFKFRNVV